MPRPKPPIDEEVRDLLAFSGDARCQRYNPAIFDIVPGQGTGMTFANRRAAAICLECPVMMTCLEHAVKHRKTGAIYGSLTDEERAEWAEKQLAAV